MKKILKVLLIISGVTLILVALSVNSFPEWLTIPGGILILLGVAFNAVLDAGGKIKGWIDLLEKSDTNPKEAKLSISASERIDNGVPYIGAVVTNVDNDNLLKCFCVLKSIKFNGHIDDELKYQITQHTNRISWSGGSEENVGIKHIDSGGIGEINLVSLRGIGTLVFETAKRQRGKNLNTGIYEIDLVLQGKIGDNDFRKKPFNVRFEYVFKGEQTSVPFHGNVLSGNLGNYKIRLLDENETAA
jgi:hypothetical protein